MESYSKTLLLVASKLGVKEKDSILSKAAEYDRRLQTKITSNSSITDTARLVICLDLASTACGHDIDPKTVVKYSGIKPKMYANSKRFLENLLEFSNEPVTTALVCAAMQCSDGIKELADKILAEYREKKTFMYADLNQPQYICMAVYQASRLHKKKISKSKLQDKARLKPSQWTILEAEWSRFIEDNLPTFKSRMKTPLTKVVEDETVNKTEIVEQIEKYNPEDPQMEQYFSWRKRTLANAFREVAKAKEEGYLVNESKKKQAKKDETTDEGNKQVNIDFPSGSKEADLKSKMEDLDPKALEEAFDFRTHRSGHKSPLKQGRPKSPIKGMRLLFPVDK